MYHDFGLEVVPILDVVGRRNLFYFLHSNFPAGAVTVEHLVLKGIYHVGG